MPILVTGAAGFIGYHASAQLLAQGHDVVGLDNLNAYYDPELKMARLARLQAQPNFTFVKAELAEKAQMADVFARFMPAEVVHLAAQAGVRYSIENPWAYQESNLAGFLAILEGCLASKVRHLVYASSSSVYGGNDKQPFSVDDVVDHPLSLYAASKKANELMAHAYAHLHALPVTGLRFFSVYGPWGRPDMALFKFTKAILEGHPIDVYNHGAHARDFTHIDDIVAGILGVLGRPPQPQSANASATKAPYRVYNLGSDRPVALLDLIALIEKETGKTAIQRLLPLQPGDAPTTWADIEPLRKDVGYEPRVGIEEGVARFVAWYRSFYGV